MQFEGAVVREQGQTFAIAVVKDYVLDSETQAQQAQISLSPIFPGMPIVLMSQDARGIPRYFGRCDIVDFLSNIDYRRIPWKRYSVN